MIAIYSWNRLTKTIQILEPSLLEHNPDRLTNPNEVIWIDLANPTEAEEQQVLCRIKPIHTLTLEDISYIRRNPGKGPHFPKVEEFPDYLFVVFNPLTRDYQQATSEPVDGGPRSPFTQLSGILTKNTLITHHYDRLACIEQVKSFLGRHRSMVDRGPDYIFHLLLDNIVDEHVPILDRLDGSLDALELELLEKPAKTLFHALVRLKREVVALRKTLIYEREILVRLARGEFELVDARETAYYRNVYDHLVRFTELIESSRDLITDLMQSYLAASANKLNEVMKALAMMSTAILPMTLIAGIYGMNFHDMPELRESWGYPGALVVMLLVGVGSVLFFKWKKWF